MTVTQRDTCLKLLGDSEFPIGYTYRVEGREAELYAFFTEPKWDDMAGAPLVGTMTCLKYDNKLTDKGREWINGAG